MGYERLFRRGVAVFDWSRLARALDVPSEVAHPLYVRAVQQAADEQRAEALYRCWLECVADEREAVAVAVPGRRTRVESIGSHGLSPAELRALGPGKLSLVQLGQLDPQARLSPVPGRPLRVAPSNPDLGFDDHRVIGLQQLLDKLGLDHPRRGDVLTAAGNSARGIAGRATRWTEPLSGTTTPAGLALWHAAERRAATLYRRALASTGADLDDPAIEAALQQRGSGQSLPAELRREMEGVLAVSLANVRIHVDGVAARAAGALEAAAFTIGEDVFFSEGAFAPDTPAGRRLLAHELTHVAQALRGDAATGQGLRVSQPDEPHEREADAVAQRVERQAMPVATQVGPAGSPAHATERAAVIWRAPRPAGGQPATAETPVAMTVSLAGLTFAVPENIRFRAGQRLEQGLAVAIRRLIGGAYQPGMKHRAAVHLQAGGFHGTGSLAGAARGGEPMGRLNVAPDVAVRLIGWLDAQGLTIDLSQSQRELLSLSVAASDAWRGFPTRDLQELGQSPLPAWMRYDVFSSELGRHGQLLRGYATAMERFRASQADGDRAAAVTALRALLDSINVAARVLEAVRGDASLVSHEAYRALWPAPAKGAAGPAAPAAAPRSHIAELFLAFVPTQPTLAAGAAADAGARRELLDRFSRFVLRAVTAPAGADQQLSDQPGTANAPPHPSQMTSYPMPQPPLFEAALETDHRFTMSLLFPTVFDAFAEYSYFWERIRVPDQQIGGVTNADTLHGQRPTWGEVNDTRMKRADRYAAADLGRAIDGVTGELGPAGMGAVDIAAGAAIFRYIGTGIRLAFEILGKPENEQPVVFPEEGLYLVRCRAIPITRDNAEVVRAPSVAYLPVFARSGQRMAEGMVQAAAAERDDALARMAEIDRLLGQPGTLPDRAELEDERARLADSIGSVPQRIALQQRLLGDQLKTLPERSPEAAAIRRQLEALGQMLEVREHRAADLEGAEPLNATFVTDEGHVLRLLLEAVARPPSHGRQHYYVSDVTTPNSTHADGHGKTRSEAILDAIRSILEAATGAYGRGNVSVQIDGKTYSRRIEAGEAALAMETIDNVTTALSVAAVVAAPFTGGASLVILLPVGAIGAIPAVFRIASRAENGTLRFDLQTAMDVVNIAGGLIGLGQAATPLRMVRLSGALMIAGIATHGAGMLLMGAGIVAQIEMLADLPPGLRAARLMEIIGQAMVAAGIAVGTSLAQRAKAKQTELGVNATDEDANARGISRDEPSGLSGQRGNQGPTRSRQVSLDGVEFDTQFSELSGRAQHFVRQLERRGWVRTSDVSPAELAEVSRWFGREIGVLQNPNTGRLRLVLGTRDGVLKVQVLPGEIFLVHTHPVMVSDTGDFSRYDIPSATARVEAVVDWAGTITYFNREGVLNPRRSGTSTIEPMEYDAGFMNAQGTIVGYGRIRWVDAGNGQFRVIVR